MKRALAAVALLLSSGPALGMTLASEVIFDNVGTNFAATDVQAALEEIDLVALGDVASLRDVELPEPLLQGKRYGLLWPISVPVATEFSLGVKAIKGSWPQTDVIFCMSYNYVGMCGGGTNNASEHKFNWTWESTFVSSPTADELIENNVNVRPSAGAQWRPWKVHISEPSKTAYLQIFAGVGQSGLQIHYNGHLRLGPVSGGQPSAQLVVEGDAEIAADLELDGNLTVSGALVPVSSWLSYGPLLWGDSGDSSLDTGGEVCALAGHTCVGARETNGTELPDCDTLAAGPVFYALCRTTAPCEELPDLDGDGVATCTDNCPSISNAEQTDTDSDSMGDACDADDDNDGLLDVYETDTGVFVSPTDTGTDPLNPDTDGDGRNDGEEVAAGTNPNLPDPAMLPALGLWARGLLLLLLTGAAVTGLRPRKD